MPEPFRQIRVTLGPVPGERLDKALAAAVPEALALSRSRLQALIAEGAVAADDGSVLDDPRVRLAPGTELVVTLPDPQPIAATAEAIPLAIVYEDADLIVIDKPVGLVVHPAPGAPDGTLVNALLHHCGGSLSGIGGHLRPGIVHRIDKDTSGLLVVAKSDVAHQGLAAQFKAHDLERRYLAVTWGAPDPAEARLRGLTGISWEPGAVLRVEGRIGRHPGDRKRMAVLSADGRHAVTRARVLERFPRRAKRRRRWSSAGWRPGGPIRSGCIWASPGIPWWAIRSMAAGRAPGCWRPSRGRRCTRRAWGSCIRSAGRRCVSMRRCRKIWRICWPICDGCDGCNDPERLTNCRSSYNSR